MQVLVWDGFEWDDAKNARNQAKYGMDFATAAHIFRSPVLVRRDDRTDYGEGRHLATGVVAGRFLTVVFTVRSETMCRLISARGASRHERDA